MLLQEKLLTDVELAEALGTGFKPRTIKTLRQSHKIPVVRVGDRILRYRLSAVLAALEKLEIKAVGTRARR